tara:strand:+ start:57 stop:515 length:459 start_codon:yes stop_codon:yes gene_type:complete
MNKKDISSKEQTKRWKNKLKEGTKNVPRGTRKHKKRTWCEQAVQDMLEEMDLAFDIEKSLKFKNTWKHFDINLIDYPILIEVDGNYWHGNKETMREGKPNFMQLRNKQNDMIKNWVARNAGYKLIRIWEKDIQDDYDGVKSKILSAIKGESE